MFRQNEKQSLGNTQLYKLVESVSLGLLVGRVKFYLYVYVYVHDAIFLNHAPQHMADVTYLHTLHYFWLSYILLNNSLIKSHVWSSPHQLSLEPRCDILFKYYSFNLKTSFVFFPETCLDTQKQPAKQTQSYCSQITIIFVGLIKANSIFYMVPHVHATVVCSAYI